MSRHHNRPSWFPPPPSRPRGAAKLEAALTAFRTPVSGRVAADLGACAGGFTLSLLEAGARCVYAVDAGHGQLLGSLRLDARVVNLERTNIALLNQKLIPDRLDLITVASPTSPSPEPYRSWPAWPSPRTPT
ncbi:MAG TPA: SAM-dependent methyltransferase [Candidatus Dormibacteraeota bacterium]|nr:SAM-dependent methyltransferase [Candidatus Dormibacteraeota bacterium]